MRRAGWRAHGGHNCGRQFMFKLVNMRDQCVVSSAVGIQTHGVNAGARGVLNSALAKGGNGGLGSDHQHRHIVFVSRGNPGNHIGGARTRG